MTNFQVFSFFLTEKERGHTPRYHAYTDAVSACGGDDTVHEYTADADKSIYIVIDSL